MKAYLAEFRQGKRRRGKNGKRTMQKRALADSERKRRWFEANREKHNERQRERRRVSDMAQSAAAQITELK